jgi:hypothetical protein
VVASPAIIATTQFGHSGSLCCIASIITNIILTQQYSQHGENHESTNHGRP